MGNQSIVEVRGKNNCLAMKTDPDCSTEVDIDGILEQVIFSIGADLHAKAKANINNLENTYDPQSLSPDPVRRSNQTFNWTIGISVVIHITALLFGRYGNTTGPSINSSSTDTLPLPSAAAHNSLSGDLPGDLSYQAHVPIETHVNDIDAAPPHDREYSSTIALPHPSQAPGLTGTLLHVAECFITPLYAIDAALTYLTSPLSGVESTPVRERYQRHIFQNANQQKKKKNPIPFISNADDIFLSNIDTDLPTDDAIIALQEIAFARQDDLETILGEQFFDVIQKSGVDSFKKRIDIIATKITDPDLVFSSMEHAVLKDSNGSIYKEMLYFSQRIEKYKNLVSLIESVDASLILQNTARKIQILFSNTYTDIFTISDFSESWPYDFISEEMSENRFNEALNIYRQHPQDQAWDITAENIKYVFYFAAFSLVDIQIFNEIDPSSIYEGATSGVKNQCLFEIQYAYKLIRALSEYTEDITLPINTTDEIAHLQALQLEVAQTNTTIVNNTKNLISFLYTANSTQDFGWLINSNNKSQINKTIEKESRAINNFLKNGFPSLKEFAATTLKQKILEKTGLDVNPDQLILIQFNTQIWDMHHLSLCDPLPNTSTTLTNYLLRNLNQYIRNNIGVDRNSWGIYPADYQANELGCYNSTDQFSLTPTDFEKIVIDLDFYDDVYHPALNAYWEKKKNVQSEETKNLMRAIVTLKKSALSNEGKNIFLQGLGLLDDPENTVTASLFDINGYQATDMLVFRQKPTTEYSPKEVTILYMPRTLQTREFKTPFAMREWIKRAAGDQDERMIILNHFGLAEQMNGFIYRGVEKLLMQFETKPDLSSHPIWSKKKIINDSVIKVITQRQKERLDSDAEHLTKSNFEVKRDSLIEFFAVTNKLLPNPITPFLSIFLDVQKMISADDDDELSQSKGLLTMDVINLVIMATMEGIIRLQTANTGSLNTIRFINEKLAAPEQLVQSTRNLILGNNEHFIEPVKVSRTDLLRQVPPKYWDTFEMHENHFYTYLDPLTNRYTYLIKGLASDTYIDIGTNIEWQPRRYDIATRKRWETGIDNQEYAPLDAFDTDSASSSAGDIDLILYQMEHGHYIGPVEVTLSQGRLKVISGYDKIKAAVAMRLETLPYEVVATKNSVVFHREEIFTPAPISQIQNQDLSLSYLKHSIEQGLEGYARFIASPAAYDEVAAEAAMSFLKGISGITEVSIGNIRYWKTPYKRGVNAAQNHFFVSAKLYEDAVVIDLSAHRFNNWGITAPIISTEADWITQLQQSFNRHAWLLAKIRWRPNGLDNVKLSPDSRIGPFENTGNTQLFSDANWYSDEGLQLTRELQKEQQFRNAFSSKNTLGASSNSGWVILDKGVSASKQDVIQKNIDRNFKLYRSSDTTAQTLFLSAHGGFMKNTGEIAIPDNLKIDFLGPHGRTLADPGIGLINHEGWLPYATVDKQGFVGNEFKRVNNDFQFHGPIDQLKANGVDTVGAVKNYELGKFSGTERNGTPETPEAIAKAIDANRVGSGVHMDVLTVRNRFIGSVKLSEVFDMMKNNPEFASYEKLIFSACRVDMSNKNAASYSVKSMELVVAKKDASGWRIVAVLNPAPSDKSRQQAS